MDTGLESPRRPFDLPNLSLPKPESAPARANWLSRDANKRHQNHMYATGRRFRAQLCIIESAKSARMTVHFIPALIWPPISVIHFF
jgi:hypothetical protein